MYVANGAEAIVYRCFTTDEPYDNFPDEAALKIYFSGEGKNITDKILIDEQLTEQGLRYPVYGWVEKDGFYAKFEEFLGDYKDFSKFPGSFEDGNVRDEVIKRLATLHGGGKFPATNNLLVCLRQVTLLAPMLELVTR